MEHLQVVFQELRQHQQHANLKSVFLGSMYLGNIVYEQGVAADPTKIAAMVKWS